MQIYVGVPTHTKPMFGGDGGGILLMFSGSKQYPFKIDTLNMNK